MASVFKRDGAWVVKFLDGTGHWRQKRTSCAAKLEAKRFGEDLERKAERQREGLEALPSDQPRLTFGELMDWGWNEYGRRLRSPTIKAFIEKHLRSSIGPLALRDVTAARLEELLNGKVDTLAPESRNHLRAMVHRIFGKAIRRGQWSGANPAAAVARAPVPRRLPQYLRHSEVPATLDALDARWRALFACAVFTGMRRGELLALRKSDVDLEANTIAVGRSHDNETTKGGHADLLPLAEELRPYLVSGIESSPSKLVFPRADGSMHARDLAVDKVLRRALGRAGIVEGYVHKCRRKSCAFAERQAHADCGRCPKCNMRLWAKPQPRHVRFHDLRHTTATLLLKAGVPLATVQKILRHKDPALTSEIYGHLDLDDMRAGINRLAFAPPPAAPPPSESASVLQLVASAPEPHPDPPPRGAPVVRSSGRGKVEGRNPSAIASELRPSFESGRLDSNQRPLAPQARTRASQAFPTVRKPSQLLETTTPAASNPRS